MNTSYESIDGRPALRFERRIAYPVEAVWGAITDPDELGRWFPTAVAGEMRAGGQLTFAFVEHDLPPMTGAVTAYDPPSLLAFCWGRGPPALRARAGRGRRAHRSALHGPARLGRQGRP